ncbi:MAG: zinc-binding dehydrogenase [Lautropia sp.]
MMKVLAYVGGEPKLVEREVPAIGGRQLLVAVRYAGLNPADLMQLAGGYASPPGAPADVAGIEVCGTVVAVGPAVSSHAVGDRVFGLVGGGGFAGLVAVDEDLVTRLPDELDERTGAAVPETFITAHDALFTQGELASGERVLIHGGTGGVGSAAIGLAVLAGAEVFATVRSDAGAELVRSLGARPVSAADFVADLTALTGGAAADVIVDLVGAPNYPGNFAVLAHRGRLVSVGLAGGDRVAFSLAALMRVRGRLIGTVLRSRPYAEKARAVAAFARQVVPHLASGRLRVLIDTVIPIEDFAAARRRLEAPGKRGNILLDLGAAPAGAIEPIGTAGES